MRRHALRLRSRNRDRQTEVASDGDGPRQQRSRRQRAQREVVGRQPRRVVPRPVAADRHPVPVTIRRRDVRPRHSAIRQAPEPTTLVVPDDRPHRLVIERLLGHSHMLTADGGGMTRGGSKSDGFAEQQDGPALRLGTTFCAPTTQIARREPPAYPGSWLPLAEAIRREPVSVTAWTLPTMTSGVEINRQISASWVARSMAWPRALMASYRPLALMSSSMPDRRRVSLAPVNTVAPSGIRSLMRARAAAAWSSISTVKPCAVSAAAARSRRCAVTGSANDVVGIGVVMVSPGWRVAGSAKQFDKTAERNVRSARQLTLRRAVVSYW